jgi:hypothetical protein
MSCPGISVADADSCFRLQPQSGQEEHAMTERFLQLAGEVGRSEFGASQARSRATSDMGIETFGDHGPISYCPERK